MGGNPPLIRIPGPCLQQYTMVCRQFLFLLLVLMITHMQGLDSCGDQPSSSVKCAPKHKKVPNAVLPSFPITRLQT